MALSEDENEEIMNYLKLMNFSYPIYLKMDTMQDDYKYYLAKNERKLFDLAHVYCLETQLAICSRQEYLTNHK